MRSIYVSFISMLMIIVTACVSSSTDQSSISQTQNQSVTISSGDSLNDTGFIGEWDKTIQLQNGSPNGNVCCERLIFMVDPQPKDLVGDVVYIENGDTLAGDFEVVPYQDSLFFNFYNGITAFGYVINDTILTLTSSFNGNTIEDIWQKSQ